MRRSRWSKPLALALGLTLVAAACGDDDDANENTTETTETTDGGSEPTSDFLGCEVTDEGGVDDRSFNQTAFEGLQDAAEEVGFEPVVLESASAADYVPNVEELVAQDCDLIVTVGFALGDATIAAATANPDERFAIVDNDLADSTTFEDITLDNVRELTFQTDQAAFLAGYVAAAVSETGKVGTFGGRPFPTVTIFMDGFAAGVAMYNADSGEAVELIGWDPEANGGEGDGLFTGDFENVENGENTTNQLLDAGADVIMPVAGPVGQGTINAVNASDTPARIVWIDSDGCVQFPDDCGLFLTSVQKKMDLAVSEITVATANGEFVNGLYVGTLENGGVDLAPFHDQEGDVPEEIVTRLAELRQQIIDTGELPIPGG